MIRVRSYITFVCKIPLLARRTRPRPKGQARRATIGYLVYKYYVISRGGGGFQMLTVDYGGGGLAVDYVIKFLIFSLIPNYLFNSFPNDFLEPVFKLIKLMALINMH